jgi:hypothetical protein
MHMTFEFLTQHFKVICNQSLKSFNSNLVLSSICKPKGVAIKGEYLAGKSHHALLKSYGSQWT